MSTENQARALMNRQQHTAKNRQQAMLGRAASEIGLPSPQQSNSGINPLN